jgi:hypothetical protein
MRFIRYSLFVLPTFSVLCFFLTAQQTMPSEASSTVVPRLVNFSGKAVDEQGKPISGTSAATFAIYKDQEGGVPLWMETQNISADKAGHYSAQLGATKSGGLPVELFSSGEARWLGVAINGGKEQPRTLLMSVPYALKALDAETIGGRPASSFMLAPVSSANSGDPTAPPGAITGSGTADFVPMFTGATTIGNSKIFQTVGGNVGIATTTPAAKLDVKGTGNVRDTLTLFPKSTHPVLSVHGTALSVDHTGLLTFVSGQTFPGTGTVTSVGSGAGLTGGPITASGTLSIADAGVTNTMLAHPSLTVGAGTGLSGGGSVSLGGSTTLNLAPNACASGSALSALPFTCSPFATLGANTFNASQAINGILTATGLIARDANVGTAAITGGQFASTGAGAGVWGGIESGDVNAYGIYGQATSATGSPIGVYGWSYSQLGVGVFGQKGIEISSVGSNFRGAEGVGAWGDGGTGGGSTWGVLGTVDDGYGGVFENNSALSLALYAYNYNSSAITFYAGGPGGDCEVDANGNLACTGSVAPIVAIDGARKVAMPAIESPKNWFEDAGSAQLVNGSTVVALDPDFTQTVNTGVDYHVFLTPTGDSRGLYVYRKTTTSFEVREQGGGTSSIEFDYRIMALRKNYENVRFADHTHDPDPTKQMLKRGFGPGHESESRTVEAIEHASSGNGSGGK